MKFIVYTINRYNFCVYIHDLDDDDENKTRIRDTYVFMHIYILRMGIFLSTHYLQIETFALINTSINVFSLILCALLDVLDRMWDILWSLGWTIDMT